MVVRRIGQHRTAVCARKIPLFYGLQPMQTFFFALRGQLLMPAPGRTISLAYTLRPTILQPPPDCR